MKQSKTISVGVAATVALVFSGCGTLFYPEREGKPSSDHIDPTVMVLDCCGLLFGIIPGVVALVLDYDNRTIYYTEAEYQEMTSDTFEAQKDHMIAIHCEDMSPEGISAALSKALGHNVSSAEIQFSAL